MTLTSSRFGIGTDRELNLRLLGMDFHG